MTDLFKRVKTICENEKYKNFAEENNHFVTFRDYERIYFNEYRTNIFELRKTGVNNLGDTRTWCYSYSHQTEDKFILDHLNLKFHNYLFSFVQCLQRS